MAPIRTTALFTLLASVALASSHPDRVQRWRRQAAVTETVTVTVTAECGATGVPVAPEPVQSGSTETCDEFASEPTETTVPNTEPEVASDSNIVEGGDQGAVTTGGDTTTAPVTTEGDATTAPVTTDGGVATAPVTTEGATDVPPPTSDVAAPTGDGSGNDVFAHYMLGIVADHTAEDWENDMRFAQDSGVTAFALNFGPDSYAEAQLQLAYDAAEKIGFKVFMSFDFNANYYQPNDPRLVPFIQKFAAHPANYLADGKPFVSSFLGDGTDWASLGQQAGIEIFAVPNSVSADLGQNNGAAGLFSWEAWASKDNQPDATPVSLDKDARYFEALGGKPYMMPVSPWFFTHYGKEVPYSKNFLFMAEDLWLNRWNQVLESQSKGTRFVEILTWNDFGESSYLVDPATTKVADDGHSKWTAGFNHAALMDVAKPYIKAFKAGASAPVVEQDGAVFWYRPHLKTAECDATDNFGSKPTGWELVEDTVFVAVMTKNGGTLTLTAADGEHTEEVPAGVQMVKFPMVPGAQSFSLTTPDGTFSAQGAHEISDQCIEGRYNFNIEAGSLAALS